MCPKLKGLTEALSLLPPKVLLKLNIFLKNLQVINKFF